jgi:hypothetical protein
VSSVRYLNDWSPSDPSEADAYEELLAEAARHGLAVEQLELPATLLDLR